MHKQTIGVVIGRFQVDDLTDGHVALIDHVKNNSDDVCILVGVAPERTARNPLPYVCVAQNIRNNYPGFFHIHPLPDVPGNDLQWSHYVDMFLKYLFPDAEIKLYGGRNSFADRYHGRHRPVVEFIDFDTSVTATAARSEIVNNKPEDNPAFRRGVIYAVGNYVSSKLPVSDGQLQSLPQEATAPKDNLKL